MKKHKRAIIITVSIVAVLAAGLTCLFIILANSGPVRYSLDDEYYATSESMSIDHEEYESLIDKKKSFVILVDKLGCIKTADISNYFEDLNIKYYRLSWNETRKSSLHDKVKLSPSVAIVIKGEVVAWLRADSDEDEPRYNDSLAFKVWLSEYIKLK